MQELLWTYIIRRFISEIDSNYIIYGLGGLNHLNHMSIRILNLNNILYSA